MKLKKENKVIILSIFALFLFTIAGLMNVEINSNLATNNNNQQDDIRLKLSNPYTDITAEEAYNMINNKILYPDLLILDVRTQGEYDTNHICNATLIPYTEIVSRISELEPWKNREIIVYCGSGVRSVYACEDLDFYNFTNVFNMLEGISAWLLEGYEVCTNSNGNPSGQILINGTATGVGAHNWTWAETQPWCSGAGTLLNPYVIEDLIIDGEAVDGQSCISIYNSEKYFIIRNCTLYNAGTTFWDCGIKLENVTNGRLINNNCSINQCGIYLIQSSNVNISGNILNDNDYGLSLDEDTEYCIVSDNDFNNNYYFGITTDGSSYNLLSRNTLNDNGQGVINSGGIGLFGSVAKYSTNNNVTENILNGSMNTGIYLSFRATDNFVYKNYFLSNINHALDSSDPNDNFWDNSIIGNYWDNYTGVDDNDDGIGDTPYTFIRGSANANDTLPIYGDPFHHGEKIHIDGSGVSGHSWSWASTRAWCSGSGTSDDPYVIQDLMIDGANVGSCIIIGNSSVHFKIENCRLNNTGDGSTDACIKLESVLNGEIINNNCTHCSNGIYLESCSSNTIKENYIIYSEYCVFDDNPGANAIGPNTCIQPVTWDQIPTDQIIEYNTPFQYDLNASSSAGIDHWEINNTNFDIDLNGVISNNTLLNTGVHNLRVRAFDNDNYYCTGVFKLSVLDPSPPTWDETPTDQFLQYGSDFSYDLNASDVSGIHHYWLNDTSNFDIDYNTGEITNIGQVPIGVYWLEARAFDPYDKFCSANFSITVQDTTPPSWVQAPSEQTLEFGGTFNYNLDATDPSGIDVWWLNDTTDFIIDDNTGEITNIGQVPIGEYWLEVNVNDTLGYILTGTFKIIVEDTTPPEWVQAPSNQIMELGDTFNYDLNATDLSPIGSWDLNVSVYFYIDGNGVITNIGLVPVGEYWLEVTVEDIHNNPLIDTFKVTVEDNTPPEWVQAPSNQIMELGDTFYYDLNATDLSPIGSWDLNVSVYFYIDGNGVIKNIGLVPVGEYWLEVTVEDIHNNPLIDTFKVIVEDNTPPTWLQTPNDQYVDLGNGVNYDLNATDLSGIGTWELNDTTIFEIDGNGVITNKTTLGVGIYWLEVRVNDIFNNQLSSTFRIVVQDVDSPIWTQIPTDQYIEFGYGINYDLDASDASGIDHWWLNDTTFFTINDATGVITNNGQVPVGVYWLEVRAYDPYNHFCSANFSINVQDTTDPTWDFIPTDQDIEYGDGLSYDLSASDAAGIDDWWLNDTTYFDINDATGEITNSTKVPVGVYWLEVRAYDPSNHNCSATFKITVQDTTPPSWLQEPTDQYIELGDGLNYDLNATDASGIDHWWLNDTTYFIIDDITGVISNVTSLEEGVYWIEVRAYDPYGHYCSSILKITVTKPIITQDNLLWIIIIGSAAGAGAVVVITIIIVKKRRS